MQKNINLSIPKPCSEKWENFTPSLHGGFCCSCSKVVVDFTKKSDVEVLEFFINKPIHACGRFRSDQLKLYSDIAPFKLNPGIGLLKAGFLTLLFMLMSKPSSAQSISEKPKTEVVDQTKRAGEISASQNETIIIRGVVVAQEDDSPLPGVNILLRGSTIGTATDADGRFEFPKKLKEDDVLIFSFIGLQTKEFSVRKLEKDKSEIKMIMLFLDVTGEVAIEEVYTGGAPGFRRFWSKVKGLF